MRDLRNASILVDVEYVIKAHIEAAAEDSAKHVSIFRTRMERGQFFRHPYLGCREFGVDFIGLLGNAPNIPPERRINKDLGVMLHSIDYVNNERPLFFDAVLKDGYLEVPPVEDKRRVR
jgi:CRISPR-associated protein Cas5d